MTSRGRTNGERAASSASRFSRVDFDRAFPDDAACLDWLWRQIYSPDGLHASCPICGTQRKFHRVTTRQSYSCDDCGRHIHPTAGTIFHKSSTPLRLWFQAVFLMASTRCGISAKQLERELGVTYKTAWRMFTLIRNQLKPQGSQPMTGEIELDETYIGGRPRLREVRSMSESALWRDRKATVFGMAQRKGEVAAVVVPSTQAEVLMPYVKARVLPEAVVYTDEALHYRPSVRKAGYTHKRIHHAAKVYVDGDTHTQTIEGFWSLVKRGISGSHHSVSAKYLQGYLNEYVWRYNHRNDPRAQFYGILGNVASAAGLGVPEPGLGDGTPA